MADFAIGDIYSTIEELAPKYGVDPKVAKMFLTAENTGSGSTTSRSTYNGAAVSPKGASGLMQVMPATAEGLKQAGFLPADWTNDPTNLQSQISAGLAAIKEMQPRQRDPNDVRELGAMYNGGNAAHKAYLAGRPMNAETTQYIKKLERSAMELGTPLTPQQIERQASSGNSTGPNGNTSSTSSRTTTRSTLFDPAAMADYDQAFNTSQLAFSNASQQVAQTSADRPGMVMDTMQAILDAGTAAATKAGAEAAIATAGALRRQDILSKANLDPAAANNRAQVALDALDSTSAQVDARRGAMDEMLSASIFDDPFKWLSAQIKLPGAVSEYNNIVRLQQDQLGRYNAAKDIAGSQITLSQGTEADEIAKAGVAAANAASSEAVAKAKLLQQQAQGKNVSDAMSLAALARQGTGEALQRVNLTAQKLAESEGISEKEASKKLMDQNLADINRVMKAAGSQREIDAARYKSLPAKGREMLDQAASRGTFGSDFVEAVEFIDNFGSLQGMAVGNNLGAARWVQKTRETASNKTLAAQQEWDSPKNPNRMKPFDIVKVQREQLAATANAYAGQAAVNMTNAPDSNPYKADYASIAKSPDMAGNVYAQLILKNGPQATVDKLYDTYDENAFMNRLDTNIFYSKDPAMAVKKTAADIAAFYQAAAKKAVTDTNYPMFGMSKPQKTYALQLPQMAGGKLGTIDMGDPVQVERMFMMSYAQNVAASSNFSVMGGIDPKEVLKQTFGQK